jgi:hypothetical protein
MQIGDLGEFSQFTVAKTAKCYLSNACSGQNHHLKQNRACSEICTSIFKAAEPICAKLQQHFKTALQQQHMHKLQSA